MKQNTMFPSLIQKFISDEELQPLIQLVGYEDTARKLNVKTLIQYLVTAAACEWKSLRYCADVGSTTGLVDVNYSTLSKKLGQLDYALMKQVFALIVRKCNRVTRRTLKIPNQLLLVDSTTVTVGKTRLPWAVYHGERSGIKLHVSFSLETQMPLHVIETTGLKHDAPVGRQLADPRFVLVEDRAYFSIKQVDQYLTEDQDFVIRMKENVELSHVKSLQRLPVKESNVTRDFTCRLGTIQSRSEKRHRVVFFKDHENREIRVVTSLRNVAAEVVADMYKARWAIESFFRWIKQNLNVPVLFGTTENAVFNQLFAALIAYVLLKWLYNQTKFSISHARLSLAGFQRMLLYGALPLEWQAEMALFLHHYFEVHWKETV
ncbi:IS4 family transposase [Domibacillus antri]|uniref:IS4 family transposase n=1 Tax=Domibacillus antri TaxID=1714264 RepID=A0A1Q8Q1G1_9BACI|nr:IS4 family transposase [Domibacillus antri]OLN21151.1 IS4 family transposase [Domibacillus antri]